MYMASNKLKILIADDDPMISVMYKTKLESEDYEIVTAANGVEAKEKAEDEKPDLILLDVIMPQIDGFAVLEGLKDSAKTKKIPVVLLTNLGTDEDREKGLKLGAEDYLVKANLTPEQVSDKVKKYLEK